MTSFRYLGFVACIFFVAPARSQDANAVQQTPPPSPGEVKKLDAWPARIVLTGKDDSAQLVVTGELADRMQDVTGDVKYAVANPAVASVTSDGRIVPLGNGITEIRAAFGDKTATIALKVESIEDAPINFGNQIVPVLSKLGCSGGSCHGKIGGQNGFALALFGHDAEFDFRSLVKENRGRRVFPASPENSLLLLKATGAVTHAGGKRTDPESDSYKLLRRWIESGTPFGSKDAPTVVKISVQPESRLLPRNNRQQLAVTAHYSDGTTSDVTRQALYESNDQEVAAIDNSALVRTKNMSGDAAIMVRYFDQVAVFRAAVPFATSPPKYAFEERTVVDRFAKKKWDQLGIGPSEPCTDEQFLRRVSLDLSGTLPTPKQVRAFLESNDPEKRDRLIEDLLQTDEFSYLFANKWAGILRVSRRNGTSSSFGFHGWIRNAIANDMPYDQFVRGILAASGDESGHPPVAWYKDLKDPKQFADDTAQVFLGLRIGCAQCHHHPYEKWSQDDYYGMAAFFGRVGRKDATILAAKEDKAARLVIYNMPSGTVFNKRTDRPATIQPLGGEPIDVPAEDDPRHRLVDWLSNPKNPYFARAVANRYWSHFFGRGIVDPIDDMRLTNPPSNPELLDALAKELVDSKFSLKHLVRTIVRSRTYQLSSTPNESNKSDRQSFARFYPRRMQAEVLFDAVNQVTSARPKLGNFPTDRHAPSRALMLPDEGFNSYFLDVFGRPQRLSACECERVPDANLSQSLHLLNSQEMNAQFDSKADLLVKDSRPDDQKIKELFVWVFGRQPSDEQLSLALEHVNAATNKKTAYGNMLWALINTREFVFNQ